MKTLMLLAACWVGLAVSPVAQPLGEDLDQAAQTALQQWRFEPGEKDGKAVLVQVDVKTAFTMPKSKGGR